MYAYGTMFGTYRVKLRTFQGLGALPRCYVGDSITPSLEAVKIVNSVYLHVPHILSYFEDLKSGRALLQSYWMILLVGLLFSLSCSRPNFRGSVDNLKSSGK